MKGNKRYYILYDGRACGAVGTEDATCLVFCDYEAEARSYKGDFGTMACYSYSANHEKNELTDEKWEWDYFDEE